MLTFDQLCTKDFLLDAKAIFPDCRLNSEADLKHLCQKMGKRCNSYAYKYKLSYIQKCFYQDLYTLIKSESWAEFLENTTIDRIVLLAAPDSNDWGCRYFCTIKRLPFVIWLKTLTRPEVYKIGELFDRVWWGRNPMGKDPESSLQYLSCQTVKGDSLSCSISSEPLRFDGEAGKIIKPRDAELHSVFVETNSTMPRGCCLSLVEWPGGHKVVMARYPDSDYTEWVSVISTTDNLIDYLPEEAQQKIRFHRQNEREVKAKLNDFVKNKNS